MDTDADGCADGIEIISVDGDCAVGFPDFLALLSKWNTNSASGTWNDTGSSAGGKYLDTDGSNAVDFGDFLTMLQMWNKSVNTTLCPVATCLEP
jgi:hypothetical protein